MSPRPDDLVPLRFDMSALVQRSVATLYSHLVTRPTGRALRLGIEGQIGELGSFCLSVLDFRQVVILDYSCADETVAKLLQRFLPPDRPADAFFIARGLAERHMEPIEEVLRRHDLALVAELEDGGTTLLGPVDETARRAWAALEALRRGTPAEVAVGMGGSSAGEVADALERLVSRRVAIARPGEDLYFSLSALITPGPA